MTTLTLTLECDNAALQEPDEIADVLRTAADQVAAGNREGYLRDLNGNTVGHWEFKS